MNSDWWNQVSVRRDGEPELLETAVHHAEAWRLYSAGRVASADLWVVRDLGVEVRYSINGELRRTHLYRGTNPGAEAFAAALAMRDVLEAKGWTRDYTPSR